VVCSNICELMFTFGFFHLFYDISKLSEMSDGPEQCVFPTVMGAWIRVGGETGVRAGVTMYAHFSTLVHNLAGDETAPRRLSLTTIVFLIHSFRFKYTHRSRIAQANCFCSFSYSGL